MFDFLLRIRDLEQRVQELESGRIALTLKVKSLNELFYERLKEKYCGTDKDGERTPKKSTRKRSDS
jgi:hypothetical protein